MNGTETMSIFAQSLTYSCIAFSIVFIVLGCLTLVIFAMRMLTGSASNSNSSGSAPSTAKNTSAPGTPKAEAPIASASGVKSSHIAAITAAIMAVTQGRGRIVNVAPSSGMREISSEATRTWRTASILQTVSRRLAPTWKR